ncbi:MAG: hypothetical protein GY854_26640 [Deltaproteobacteria bacterium]|nr:hypothetical protein [Deltaproteobacteria bacterium]
MGKLLDFAVLLAYPLIVFFGLPHLGVRWTALLLLALMARRFIALVISNRKTSRILLVQAAAMGTIIATAAAIGSAFALHIAPFAVSLTFIALFVTSLKGTPIIERFARLQKPELPPAEVKYCLNLTKIWIGVLSVNSALLFFAALFTDEKLWAILVGPVSYSLFGTVFSVEYIIRKRRFQDFSRDNFIDMLLKPILEKKAAR